MPKNYDFAGYVTKNDIRCSDGVTIRHDAFTGNNQKVVPLVWQHDHNDPTNVLGNIQLETRPDGVYGYGTFNKTEKADSAHELIKHGDITSMSIAANHIKKQGNDVIHGRIYEVSLVLAGANPGAVIEKVLSHSDEEGESAIIYTDNQIHSKEIALEIENENGGNIMHSDNSEQSQASAAASNASQETSSASKADEGGKTIGDVLNTLTDEQMEAVEALVAAIAPNSEDDSQKPDDSQQPDDVKHSDNKGGITMQKNVFDGDQNGNEAATLTHADLDGLVVGAVKSKAGSLKDYIRDNMPEELQHSGTAGVDYGVKNIESLFPDYKSYTDAPQVLDDQNMAAQEILDATSKTPFSRVKTIYTDVTDDAKARARGYIKGNQKLDSVYEVLHRTTDPQTVYVRNKLDRDDIIDITDFDVVAWVQAIMKSKLTQELAKAIMIGDGRDVSDRDKIKPANIRPIIGDDELYTMKATAATIDDLFGTVIKSRINYQGSGQPSMYVHPALLANLLLLRDKENRFLFGDIPSTDAMAARFRVKSIVETTIMPVDHALIVNLADYGIGSTKGGEVTSFDDFDIDFNQYTYLNETRLSGALKAPKSAIDITITDQTPAGGSTSSTSSTSTTGK